MKKIIQSKLIFTKDGNLDIVIEKDTNKIKNDKSNKLNKSNKRKETVAKATLDVEKPLPLPEDYRPPPELNQ